MSRLPRQAKNCLQMFVNGGGLVGAVAFLVEGEIWKAFLTSVLFSIFFVFTEHYFNKLK